MDLASPHAGSSARVTQTVDSTSDDLRDIESAALQATVQAITLNTWSH